MHILDLGSAPAPGRVTAEMPNIKTLHYGLTFTSKTDIHGECLSPAPCLIL